MGLNWTGGKQTAEYLRGQFWVLCYFCCSLMFLMWGFVDDTKLFYRVSGLTDSFSEKSGKVAWAEKWQMQFNCGKCNLINLGRGNGEFCYMDICIKEVEYQGKGLWCSSR